MPKLINIPLAGSTNVGRNKKNSSEKLLNMMAILHDGTPKKQVTLQSTAGFKSIYEFQNENVLALHTVKEILYVVTDKGFYDFDGVTMNKIGIVSFPLNPFRVSIDDNGFDIVFVAGKGYHYNIQSGVLASYDTDPAYSEADTVTFLDGYFVFNKRGTMQFFVSDLYSTNLDATKFASKEANPDNLMGVIASNRNLWLIGRRSTEVWSNIGSSDFPFLRIAGAVHEKGTINHNTIAKIDDSVFFLADDGAVYQTFGLALKKVSSEAIEYEINRQIIKTADAFTYSEEGHTFYCLTLNNANTFVYDTKTMLWHNRSSLYVYRWRVKDIIDYHPRGMNLGCDYSNGKLYQVDMDLFTEDGTPITREIYSVPIHNEVNYATMNEYQIDMVTGINDDPKEDGIIRIQFSDDGGVNWSNLKEASVGKRGDTNKIVKFRRLGRFRERTMKILYQEPTNLQILGTYGRLSDVER